LAAWTLLEWLGAIATLIVIIGGVAAAALFFVRHRAASMAHQRRVLVGEWTNEGAVDAVEDAYVTLKLEDHLGDIVGELETPESATRLELHVFVGWMRSTLWISRFTGRGAEEMATVRLTIKENDNRLLWKLKSSSGAIRFPRRTLLWITSGRFQPPDGADQDQSS